MEITGKLYKVFKKEAISDKFKKREFVLEVAENPQYPQLLKIQLVNDKCNLIDAFSFGDLLEVSINLQGREWTSRTGEISYFNTIEAWKIVKK